LIYSSCVNCVTGGGVGYIDLVVWNSLPIVKDNIGCMWIKAVHWGVIHWLRIITKQGAHGEWKGNTKRMNLGPK
jgi:hypothetical protein